VLPLERVATAGDAQVWEVPSGSTGSLPVSRWREFKKVPGVVIATIPIADRVTLYALWGDALAWTCSAVAAAGLAVAYLRCRRGVARSN
jgi:hypothetical protein